MKTTDKIFETAMRMFLKYGYQGTSMDEVAKEAGVAKQTIYSNFHKKENILHMILEKKSQNYYNLIENITPTKNNFDSLLESFCRNFMNLVLDKKLAAIHRIVLSEFPTNPTITKSFFLGGPTKTYQVLAMFLKSAQRDKIIKNMESPSVLADNIISILKGQTYLELLFGVRQTISKQEKEAFFDDAFKSIKTLLFLR